MRPDAACSTEEAAPFHTAGPLDHWRVRQMYTTRVCRLQAAVCERCAVLGAAALFFIKALLSFKLG